FSNLEHNFGGRSSAYFVGLPPKDDKLVNLDVIADRAMQNVLDWTRQKLGALADEIADGNIAVDPYRLGTKVPCGSCAYRSVCRFDRFVNRHKDIEGLKPAEVIEKMSDEVTQ
ncbi:MAG TPA: PD-(D/E)XK nuclease family protein, partial [Tepidisphaeraceae bacterium]|nr:PD-(D/E)XK nuclease family protein [Tepidisphaeraceae bacterium]